MNKNLVIYLNPKNKKNPNHIIFYLYLGIGYCLYKNKIDK